MLEEELRKEIVDKILEEVSVERILVFGSTVRDDSDRLSDIDIAIFSKQDIKIGLLKEKLNEEVRTLRDIDVVVFNKIKDKGLKRKILEEGVVIYERSSKG